MFLRLHYNLVNHHGVESFVFLCIFVWQSYILLLFLSLYGILLHPFILLLNVSIYTIIFFLSASFSLWYCHKGMDRGSVSGEEGGEERKKRRVTMLRHVLQLVSPQPITTKHPVLSSLIYTKKIQSTWGNMKRLKNRKKEMKHISAFSFNLCAFSALILSSSFHLDAPSSLSLPLFHPTTN